MVEFAARRGGRVEVPELMARFAGPRTRKCDFKRRQLSPSGAGGKIVTANGIGSARPSSA